MKVNEDELAKMLDILNGVYHSLPRHDQEFVDKLMEKLKQK